MKYKHILKAGFFLIVICYCICTIASAQAFSFEAGGDTTVGTITRTQLPSIWRSSIYQPIDFIGGSTLGYPLYEVESRYDTTLLFKGVDTASHEHQFVSRSVKTGMFSGGISCAVWHGPTGCPDGWLNENEICTVCLKHINVKETRYEKKPVDQYQQALDRLNKILKK